MSVYYKWHSPCIAKVMHLEIVENFLLSYLKYNRELPLQIDITNLCNLKCAHCYHSHHLNQNSLTEDDWFYIIDEYSILIKKLNAKANVIFCGGEPTLSKLLFPVFSHIINKIPEAKITILTNGTLINTSFINKLNKYQKNNKIHFQVSLDGHNPIEHNRIRGLLAFEKSINAIELMHSNNYSVSLLSTIHNKNYQSIERFFELAKTLGVEAMNFTRLIAIGTAENSSTLRSLYPLELKSSYEKIINGSAKYKIRTNLNLPLMHLLHPLCGSNGRFDEAIVVDYQGNYLATSRSKLKIGNFKKDNMQKILFNNFYAKQIRKENIEKCGKCIFIKRCGGDRNAAYASNGNFLGADPGCWYQTQTIKEKNKIHEEATV